MALILKEFPGWRALGIDEKMEVDDILIYAGFGQSSSHYDPLTGFNLISHSYNIGKSYLQARETHLNPNYYPYRRIGGKRPMNKITSKELPLP